MSQADSTKYPALFDLASGELHSLNDQETFLAGRSQTADLILLDVTCSRRQFQLTCQSGDWFIESLSSHVPTLCQDEPINGQIKLFHGSQIQAGNLSFQFMVSDLTDDLIVPDVGASRSLISEVTHAPAPISSDRTSIGDSRPGQSGDLLHCDPVIVSKHMLIGRDKGLTQIHLDAPNVSRVHAQVFAKPEGLEIVDLNSTNGTFVNGRRIDSAVKLTTGDRIDIGPATLICDRQTLIIRSRANNIELIGRNIHHEVINRATGKPLVLLDEINLVIRPREFVCLLGPSGSGKSTLMSVLSARVSATSGSVTLNNEDLYSNFESLKHDLAVVPQKDVMHDFLPVQDALTYTARLRLPSDTSDQEIEAATLTMLESVGLSNRSATCIRDLSGGQLKRASLANETISSPSLLFLDEVTSGLDEQTDREMMQLFRKIADDGKTVICITHSVANVERNCDLVVVLTVGGKLAFIGSPGEALNYFSIEYLGDIYEILAKKPSDEWKEAFEQHATYSRYIDDRMPADYSEPEFVPRRKQKFDERRKLFQHQLRLLTSRYLQIQLADWQALAVIAGQCVLVGTLLSMLFGDLGELSSSDWVLAHKSESLLFLRNSPEITSRFHFASGMAV